MAKKEKMIMGKCFLCHRETNLDRHHVFNGAMRNKSEEYNAVILVCRNCHERIHKDAGLRNSLKAQWQQALMAYHGWTLDEWREIFHKNYALGVFDDED